MRRLINKFKESVFSVLPITIIVLILAFTIAPLTKSAILGFLTGAVFVILGLTLFGLGADISMIQIGHSIGSKITKTKKLFPVILISFIIGIIITVAEPDLMVLGEQLSKIIEPVVLIITVGIGVGIFLVIAMLRIIFKINLRLLLFLFYISVFVIAAFVSSEFLPVSFDSGGVTTGPMTVPFIMSLGLGVAAMNGTGGEDDSFGLVALCSVGPIITTLILGLLSDTSALTYTLDKVSLSDDILLSFFVNMPNYFGEVAFSLAPIAVFFLIFNFIALKLPFREIARISVGLIYTYLGLVVFLTGVNVGFLPVGQMLGGAISLSDYKFALVPVGMLVGFFIVAAEPAVHVLNEQVEEVSGGTIKKSAMLISLMCGVAVSIGLSMIRVLTGISIWWFILPGYTIALTLSFFVPKVFTAIAFDSGGVASGPMTATFLLPFAMGACNGLNGNILTDAFGLVAMVAMTPLLTIQILGLVSTFKTKKLKDKEYLKLKGDDYNKLKNNYSSKNDKMTDEQPIIIDLNKEKEK